MAELGELLLQHLFVDAEGDASHEELGGAAAAAAARAEGMRQNLELRPPLALHRRHRRHHRDDSAAIPVRQAPISEKAEALHRPRRVAALLFDPKPRLDELALQTPWLWCSASLLRGLWRSAGNKKGFFLQTLARVYQKPKAQNNFSGFPR
jgi:hypothetical protein